MINFIKNWTLPISILSGIILYFIYVNIPALNDTHAFVNDAISVIQPALIFAMLFLTFLSIGPHDLRIRRWHFLLIGMQISLFGALAYLLSYIADNGMRIILESAMLCMLCPTATAAAVVTRKLGGSAADITTYTILINLTIAVSAPALLPIAHPMPDMGFISTFVLIIGKVFPLLICPLLLAWGIRKFAPALMHKLTKFRDLPFYLWAVALALAIGVTVKAIMHSHISSMYLLGILAVTFVCCILQFFIGKKIGRHYDQLIEGGQSLGQKNTVFIIWMGYTFLSPVTAMAGGLYSVWHNIYNSWQLYNHRRSDT
ncbi:MAG: transporter [Muribaculaceae bacterium]|nr:transporter [Muribaculaceae bacterium]